MTETEPAISTPEPADARLLDLAQGVLALVWDSEAEPGRVRPQLAADGRGRTVALRRQARLVLPLAGGRQRAILLFSPDAADAAVGAVNAVDMAGAVVATARRLRGRADARTLLTGLTADGIDRLLRFLIGFGTTLFGVTNDLRWLALTRAVVDEVRGERPELFVRCRLVDGTCLAECRSLPAAAAGAELALLDGDGFGRAVILARIEANGVILVALSATSGRKSADAIIAFPGQTGVRLVTLRRGAGCERGLGDWLEAAGAAAAATRRRAMAILAQLADRLPLAGKLLVELRLATGAQSGGRPSLVVELALPVQGGILLAGSIDDRHDLLSHLMIDRAGETHRVEIESLRRWRVQGDAERFVVLLPQPPSSPVASPCWVELTTRSGSRQKLGETPGPLDRRAAIAAIAELARSLAGHSVPADLLAAIRDLPASAGALECSAIGPAIATPQVTLVLPLDADPSILRCRMGLLAREAGAMRMELLHLADERVPRSAALALLEGLHRIHGLAGTLLCPPDDGLGAGAALAAALTMARGRTIIRIGAGVLPQERGWIGKLDRFLARKPAAAAVGLPILAADDTIADAGGELALDDRHEPRIHVRGRGLPVGMRRLRTRRTSIVPGGCLAVRRADVEFLTEGASRFQTFEGATTALSLCAATLAEAWTLAGPTLVTLAPRQTRSPLDALLWRADLDLALTLDPARRAREATSRPVALDPECRAA